MPLFAVLLGNISDDLNKSGLSFQEVINELCLRFVYVGIANIFAGYLVI